MKLYLYSKSVDTVDNIIKNGKLLVENNKAQIETEIGRFCRSIYGFYYSKLTCWSEQGKSIKSIDFGDKSEFLLLVQ